MRTDPWDTGFVDLDGDQGLLGQIEGRTGAAVRQLLGEQSDAFRAVVTHAVIDSSEAYAAAITTELLPNAIVVVDHFHLVKLANDALTAVQSRPIMKRTAEYRSWSRTRWSPDCCWSATPVPTSPLST